MGTKLTLSLEKEIIENAKAYAKSRGESLSGMIENYLKLVTAEKRPIAPERLSPRVQRLRGIIKTEEKIDVKKVVEEELSKKYND